MTEAQKGDFLVIDSTDRPGQDSLYRIIRARGCVLDKQGLLGMAAGMKDVRSGLHVGTTKITDIEEALSIIKSGGWVILSFLT